MIEHDRDSGAPDMGLLLAVPHQELEERVLAAFAEAGFGDLTGAQARLFRWIDPEGTRLTALAERTRVTKQSAGFLVDRMERAGYVERVPDPTDARARLVRVSGNGVRAAVCSARTVALVEAEWRARLGARDMDELRRILLRLQAVADDPHPPRSRSREGI